MVAAGLLMGTGAAVAQSGPPPGAVIGFGTDQHNELSLLVSGFFNSNSGGAVAHSASNALGVAAGYRYRFDEVESLEFDYNLVVNDQRYRTAGAAGEASVMTRLQGFFINDVVHAPRGDRRWQPFMLVGSGIVAFHSLRASVPAGWEREAALDWGMGTDVHLHPGMGFRLEFRALDYRVPYFGNPALNTGRMMQSSLPTAGLIFTF